MQQLRNKYHDMIYVCKTFEKTFAAEINLTTRGPLYTCLVQDVFFFATDNGVFLKISVRGAGQENFGLKGDLALHWSSY